MWDDDDEDNVLLLITQEVESMLNVPVATSSSMINQNNVIIKHNSVSTLLTDDHLPEIPDAEKLSEIRIQSEFQKSLSNLSQKNSNSREIKYAEQVHNLKQENEKLRIELSDYATKLQFKNGEISLLRSEINQLKQQLQTIKMERIIQTELSISESQNRIAKISKNMEAKETELKLRLVQCSNLRMKLTANESHNSTQNLSSYHTSTQMKKQKNLELEDVSKPQRYQFIKQHLTKIPGLELKDYNYVKKRNSSAKSINTEDYLHSSFYHSNRQKYHDIIDFEIRNISSLLTQWHHSKVTKILKYDFEQRCLDSIYKVLLKLNLYAKCTYNQIGNGNCNSHMKTSVLNKMLRFEKPKNMQQQFLSSNERGVNLRRYINILTLLCEQCPTIAYAILQYKHDEIQMLTLVKESILKLSQGHQLFQHFGLIEAIVIWLNSILNNISQNIENQYLKQIFCVLKEVVFARPTMWIFAELTKCIKQFCQFPQVIVWFCSNNAENFNEKNIYTHYSCFLQVYTRMLVDAFPINCRLQLPHFELLTKVCRNHIQTVYHFFTKLPKFMQRLLPIYDEHNDVKSNDATIKTVMQINELQITNCDCYARLCLTVINITYELLRQWLLHYKNYFFSEVCEVSHYSTYLLYVIFCDNYMICFLRESDESTKYQIALICKWLTENAKLLKLIKFVEKMQNAHFIPNDIKDAHLTNIKMDFLEWNKITREQILSEQDLSTTTHLKLFELAANEQLHFELC